MAHIPTHLAGAERNVYVKAADRARAAYRKRTGATALQTIGERRAWLMAHGATMASKADAAGMTAVRKLHTTRVTALEIATDATRIGGAATGDHLAILTRQAEYATERLAILSPVKAPRKPAKLASVPDVVAEPVETPAPVDVWAPVIHAAWTRQNGAVTDSGPVCAHAHDVVTLADVENVGEWLATVGDIVACESCAAIVASLPPAPVDIVAEAVDSGRVILVSVGAEPVAPEIVPAPMPAMTRAARKASRRELAATMRAAGIKPDGLAWQLARSGVDLADIPAILAGDVAMPESVVSA